MVRNQLKKILSHLKSKDMGATIMEYSLIVTLITVVIMGGYKALGLKYNGLFNNIGSALDAAHGQAVKDGTYKH